MRTLLFGAALFSLNALSGLAATTNITPWTPLFQGVELSTATVRGTVSGERNQALKCLKVDLTNPDVGLFTTPHCTNSCSLETLSENPSLFLERNGLQAAVNCNFYESSLGPNDQPLGTPYDVEGLAISQGNVVSPQQTGPHQIALLFTTNNVPTFIPNNWPPTNTDGIFTAIGGNILLLTNGVNAGTNVVDPDPRTAIGLSQDNRYLYLMTVDGRQDNTQGQFWAHGLNYYETADWLARFGAYNGMNVDGGGSTTMCMSDCQGKSVRLNRPSFLLTVNPPRERQIGHTFGVYAKPLPSPLKELAVAPGTTTATVTWKTDLPATTRVAFGLDTNFTGSTTVDLTPTKFHAATLTGLIPGTNYLFRAISVTDGGELVEGCSLSTTNGISRSLSFTVTNAWKYTTNTQDGVNWKIHSYVDDAWSGPAPGLLYVENNTAVAPRNTPLPTGTAGAVARTYYFRTRFDFTGTVSALTFSNYVDDGAVFHLNGAEIFRLRMPAAPIVITNLSPASGTPCPGTVQQGEAATFCPDLFTISGNLLTNLVQGENVLAVEVHNQGSSADIVFGSALLLTRPTQELPKIGVFMEEDRVTMYWNGQGFTLQEATDFSLAEPWGDVPGSITSSPAVVTNTGARFFRLRK